MPRHEAAAVEANFDGLPGPTHNYSGLATGNLAAERNRRSVANPRLAALQGLAKMKALADRGYPQAVLPPHERPDLAALRALGYAGDDASVIARAARDDSPLLAACSSAAAMWAANAATVSPSADTADARVHFTPANLSSHFHRAIEAPTTTRVLRAIFADDSRFAVHDPLPAAAQFGDEGAANHTRFASDPAATGIELFVYGRVAYATAASSPLRFPARQTREASQAIARRHGLDPARTLFVQQNPAAIDAGVFHNDVIAVGNGAVLFCHESAFVEQEAVLAELSAAVGAAFTPIVVRAADVSVERAVTTYLFNSQLLTRADGGMLLVAPAECAEDPSVGAYLTRLIASGGPIREMLTFDLRQSMRNGGGPACLRLRVALTAAERAAIRANVWLDDRLHQALVGWVERNYRDRLSPADLADPALLVEGRRALDELSVLLRLGSVYPFQRDA
ncbi:MAG TPA: N-succinylarginine dihydrolase [Casimicrobiaceae bacterium]|jgi:succinylarginine dihydrolase|nr:N-succinylarginine dihydrolase [Casimicrobiaceae bacterium]